MPFRGMQAGKLCPRFQNIAKSPSLVSLPLLLAQFWTLVFHSCFNRFGSGMDLHLITANETSKISRLLQQDAPL